MYHDPTSCWLVNDQLILSKVYKKNLYIFYLVYSYVRAKREHAECQRAACELAERERAERERAERERTKRERAMACQSLINSNLLILWIHHFGIKLKISKDDWYAKLECQKCITFDYEITWRFNGFKHDAYWFRSVSQLAKSDIPTEYTDA